MTKRLEMRNSDLSLELLYALQRCLPQRLGVMRDVALSGALEVRRPGIKSGDELTQVMEQCLV